MDLREVAARHEVTVARQRAAMVVTTSQLRQELSALLYELATSEVPIVVTKYGRPVARLVPVGDHGPR